MSFEKELQETIQRASDAREEDEKSYSEFYSKWEIKRTTLLSLLERAVNVMSASSILIDCDAKRDNGGLVLQARHVGDSTIHEMVFSLNRTNKKIICSLTIEEKPEEFSLESLTDGAVQMKIKKFAYVVIRGIDDSVRMTGLTW